MLTYHLLPSETYDPATATYAPAAYADEGFIHTTKALALIPTVANRYYQADQRPYILLILDLDRLDAPWRYDAAGPNYPHIYGEINRAAILGLRPVPRASDGTFLVP